MWAEARRDHPGTTPLSTIARTATRIVDNFARQPTNIVDKSLSCLLGRGLWFVLPEGAEGNDTGATSDRRTGFLDRRRCDRKVVEEAGDRGRCDWTKLAWSGRGRVGAVRFLRALSCVPETL